MKNFLISGFRVIYIPSILIFYLVILYPFKKSYKQRLVKALEKCGPVFIKCGQSISLKPYLFSKETIEACSNLQDKVSPAKFNLKKELGIFYDDFKDISPKAIASGSIACVFEGRLKENDKKVAIKLLRKSVESVIKADLLILKNTSFFLQFIPLFKRLKIKAIVQNIESTLLHEIDFKNEEENLFKIKANTIRLYPKVKTPRVLKKYTQKHILITEFAEGIPLSEVSKLKENGINIQILCKNLIEIYLEQVYEDGFFHADFHPGNLFVNKKYEVTLIDFGITSEVSYQDRIIIAKILNGFLEKDYEKVLKAHIEGGYINANVNSKEFKEDLERIGNSFIHAKDVKQFSISGILMELFRIMEKYNIEIKEDLLLLYKTIFFVEAVVMKLDPNFDIWHVIKPWMIAWKKRNLGFKTQILSAIEKLYNFIKQI